MGDQRILMGVVGRPHGVRGHVHVHSYTAAPADLATYDPLHDEAGRAVLLRWIGEGVAELAIRDASGVRKVADRTAAEKLVNTRLYVNRDQLPAAGDDDEFYLADLVGLEAVDAAGRSLGHVAAVHDYGGGVSLEIGAMFLPFTKAVVPHIDVLGGRLTVVAPDETEAAPPDAGRARHHDQAGSPP